MCSKLQKAAKLKTPIYKDNQDTGTLQYQTSSERNGSSTCLASPLAMESNHYYRRAPTLLQVPQKVPLTEYIAVTKRICDELSENTVGKDCTEIYQKPRKSYNTSRKRRGTLATPPKRNGRPSNPSGHSSHVVLTADKGVALVVMDKSQYIDKCMALLNDTKAYKPCKDTTKKLHGDVHGMPSKAQEGIQNFETI